MPPCTPVEIIIPAQEASRIHEPALIDRTEISLSEEKLNVDCINNKHRHLLDFIFPANHNIYKKTNLSGPLIGFSEKQK